MIGPFIGRTFLHDRWMGDEGASSQDARLVETAQCFIVPPGFRRYMNVNANLIDGSLMIDDVLGWIMTALAAGAVVAALWCLYTWPAGPRMRCRGRRGHWTSWLNPLPLFSRGTCWHDLTGLNADQDGFVTCTECGVSTSERPALREGRRFRYGMLGLTFGVLAGTSGGISWQRGQSVYSAVPSFPLVLLTSTDLGAHGTEIREELQERVRNGRIAGINARHLAGEVIGDLGHDTDKWNADDAMTVLRNLWPHSREVLEDALLSEDNQTRTLAGIVMRGCDKNPSRRLLERCIEEMKDDSGQPAWYLRQRNARYAAAFLLTWYHRSEDLLLEALESDDRQQRQFAATVCGFAGHGGVAMERSVPILIDMLQDNETMGDAQMAAPALFRFGRDVIPHLQAYRDDDDAQVQGIVRHLIERLEDHNLTVLECTNRMPRITNTRHDPLDMFFLEACSRAY